MRILLVQIRLTLRWVLRDRVLHAVAGVGLLLLMMVPVFSSFSMRQVQESAIALALSASSLTLLAVATQFGAAAVFRDVDRRYTTAVLGLPVSRPAFLLGRLLGLAIFLIIGMAILAVCSAVVIAYAASTYPSAVAIAWPTLAMAFVADACKAILLAGVALLFSTVSTSFSLPFFCAVAVWLAGSASQTAYEYLAGPAGDSLPLVTRLAGRAFYYLVPNLSALDFHVQATYGLPVAVADFLGALLYSLCYLGAIAWLAVLAFSRRELP